MTLPKNSRNRRKQLSQETIINNNKAKRSDATASSSNNNAVLPIITRTSNHSTDDFIKNSTHHSHGNDADSNCSWVELDFGSSQKDGGSNENKRRGTRVRSASNSNSTTNSTTNNNEDGNHTGKPVSHVNIAQYLVDDQESLCEGGAGDDSSTTSNLSEDFSVTENRTGKNDNNTDKEDDDNDDSSCSSESSFANDGPFDDLLARPSHRELDEIIEMSNSNNDSSSKGALQHQHQHASYRSENANVPKPSSLRSPTKPSSLRSHTKPSSERSFGNKKQPNKKVSSASPNSKSTIPKQSKTKKLSLKPVRSGKSNSPGSLRSRKRMNCSPKEIEMKIDNCGVVDESSNSIINNDNKDSKDALKKKLSLKPSSTSLRRRHVQQQQPSPNGETGNGITFDTDESHKSSSNSNINSNKEEQQRQRQKNSPKPSSTTKTTAGAIASTATIPSRRRRTRSAIQDETGNGTTTTPTAIGDEGGKESKEGGVGKDGSNRSLGADSNININANARRKQEREGGGLRKDGNGSNRSLGADSKRRQGRHPTKSKPRSKSRLRKTPSRSASGSSNKEVGGGRDLPQQQQQEHSKREVRKRYKKKTIEDSEEEGSEHNYKSSRPSHSRERKKKTRSKSNEPSSAAAEAAKSTKMPRNSEGKRRRKKKPTTSTTTPKSTAAAIAAPAEETAATSPKPITGGSEKLPDVTDQSQSDAESMDNLTYSFRFQSDGGINKNHNWLNSSNNSSSSSLSHNSFAQFSLDVGDMRGCLVADLSSAGHVGVGVGGRSPGGGGGEKRLSSVLGVNCGFVADPDASMQSFNSNLNDSVVDASVVFMARKSTRASLLASNSFDGQDNTTTKNDNTDADHTGTRSARSKSLDNSSKSEKKLRRRLKTKEESSSTTKDSSSKDRKNVRRAKSGGLDRPETGLSHHKTADVVSGGGTAGSGKRSVKRIKSLTEALIEPIASKSARSPSVKRQDRLGKPSQRKKDNIRSSKPKYAGKSKSAHIRGLSTSPKNKSLKGKIGLTTLRIGDDDDVSGLQLVLDDGDDIASVSINDNGNVDVNEEYRSPRERRVRRTFSNPCPSPSIHVIAAANANAPQILHSPMSYGSAPTSYVDSSKQKSRRSSPSRQALLSRGEDDDSDDDENCLTETGYSPQSTSTSLKKIKGFLPTRGVERTPSSSLMGGVRKHFKDGPRNNMLSKMKKTFSVSGRGTSTFKDDFDDIEIGMTTMNGYVGRNERKRMLAESASRRGAVKSALYACMSDDDDSVEISDVFAADNDDASSHCGDHSLHETKTRDQSSVQSSERPSQPRRVHSLPIGVRRPSAT